MRAVGGWGGARTGGAGAESWVKCALCEGGAADQNLAHTMNIRLLCSLFVILGQAAFGADAGAKLVAELIERTTPVDGAAYRKEFVEVVKTDDRESREAGGDPFARTNNRRVKFLDSAYLATGRFTFSPDHEITLRVLRGHTTNDGERITGVRTQFDAVIMEPKEAWSKRGRVMTFGYPRLLLQFDEIVVDVREIGSLSDDEKKSLVLDLENGVDEWRKREAVRLQTERADEERADDSAAGGPDPVLIAEPGTQ